MSNIPKRVKRILVVVVALALVGGGFLFPPGLAHIQLPAEKIVEPFGFPITNTILATWVVMAVLVGTSVWATRRMQAVPTGLQNLAEMGVEALANLVEGVAGKERGKKFFPLVATIFIFILVANWMGLLPFFGTLGIVHEVHGEPEFTPLLRSASTDLNTTLGLALISVATIQVFGVRYLGFRSYVGRFVTLRGPIDMFVGLLELISEFAKIISLSFRLFGNIFAGEVLLGVIGFLMPWVAIVPFMGLELFVGAMQAFIFAMLTLVFLVSATTSHEGAHENSHERSREAGGVRYDKVAEATGFEQH